MTTLTGVNTLSQTATADGLFLNITNTASLVVSSGTAIDWSDDTVNKTLIINGTVIAEGATAIATGSTPGVATSTDIVVGPTGSINAANNAYLANGDGETFVNNGSVTSKNSALFVAGDGFQLLNNGAITSDLLKGVNLTGDNGAITNNGDIASLATIGMLLAGANAVVLNTGNILGVDAGISVTGAASSITNNGVISGGLDFDADAATSHTLVNHGVIKGGVTFSGDNAGVVVNTGKIVGDLRGENGADNFINRGHVVGAIATFTGNDILNLTGGTLDGVAQGGGGDDRYIVDRTDLELFEKSAVGVDTVIATANFRLDDNFENLTLDGKDNFYAVGNSLANNLTGNIGNNLIKGLGGADTIKGGGGDDVLIGGARNDAITDVFLFSSGDGDDTIRNFQTKGAGHDALDVSNVIGIANFNDLRNNHMSQSGANVIIDALNGDTVTLEGVKIGAIIAADFLF